MGYNPQNFGIVITEKKDIKPKLEDFSQESSYVSKNESQISINTSQKEKFQFCIFEMREKNYRISDSELVVKNNIHKYNT